MIENENQSDGHQEVPDIAPTYIIAESRHLSQNKKMTRNKSLGKMKGTKGQTMKTKNETGKLKEKVKK